MTSKLFVSTLFILIFSSCNNIDRDHPIQETPKALDDQGSSYEVVLKRRSDDMVQSLYNELVSKDAELKNLEHNIENLDKTKSDSTVLFDKFHGKNQAYFSSANSHIEEIKDSLLRDKMKLLISNNLKKYNTSIAKHAELLENMESKHLTISDLHNMLKIIRTVPLIEKYQRENLPNVKSLEGYIKKQDEVITYADTLIKK